jgi:5-methyltetrahydrofolate--homocysteine methyltransferase
MDQVVLMDGAVGTSLWEKTEIKVPVWQYNMTNPKIVKELEEEYVKAGAQIILSNTFGANRISMKKTPYNVQETVTSAMELIHQAVDGKVPTSSPTKENAKIALAIGPLATLMEPYGDLEEDEALDIFDEMIKAALPYKPDYIYIQTFIDLAMMEVAVRAASRYDIPVLASMSFEAIGKTIFGNSAEDMIDTLKPYDTVKAVGLNCSLGPDAAVPIMKTFHELTDMPLIFKPNAGKPSVTDGETKMQFDMDTFVKDAVPALDYGVRYIGGCCGTNAAYIDRLRKAIGRE